VYLWRPLRFGRARHSASARPGAIFGEGGRLDALQSKADIAARMVVGCGLCEANCPAGILFDIKYNHCFMPARRFPPPARKTHDVLSLSIFL